MGDGREKDDFHNDLTTKSQQEQDNLPNHHRFV